MFTFSPFALHKPYIQLYHVNGDVSKTVTRRLAALVSSAYSLF